MFFGSLTVIESFAAELGSWPQINVGKPSKVSITGAAYGDEMWVVVGEKGFIASSPDGQRWTRRSARIDRDFNRVTFSNGRFIAVCKAPNTGAGAKIWVSDNRGASWAARNTDVSGDAISVGLHDVAGDGKGNLIAVGGFGNMTRSFDNGQTWHRVTPSPTFSSLYGVAYGDGVWMAGSLGSIIRSTNGGASWTTVTTSRGIRSVAYGNKRWMAADRGSNKLIWSIDGLTWTDVVKSAADGGGTNFAYAFGCTYGDGVFAAVDDNGNIWTSENAKDVRKWRAGGANPGCQTVGYGNGRFLAGGIEYGVGFKVNQGAVWLSPPWLKPRLGTSWDYPYTVFDSDESADRRIGLPQYRVNTSSLNLLLETTLFHMQTLGAPVNLRLVYNSSRVLNGDEGIGLFGKNWRLRYESQVGQFGNEALLLTGGGRLQRFVTPQGQDLATASVGSPITLLPPDGVFDKLSFYGNGQYFEYTEKASRRIYRYAVVGGPGNAIWRLSRITDRSGNQLNLNVNGVNGRILSITDASGRVISFDYDNAKNLCTGINIPDGRRVEFSYDNHKNLIGMVDMNGHSGDYEYDTFGFLTKMTVDNGSTGFAYAARPGYEDAASEQDGAGDKILAAVTDARGGVTRYVVDGKDQNTIRRTDPRGEVVVFKQAGGQTNQMTDPLGALRSLEFSAAKLPASFTDALGKTTEFEHDARGNLTLTKDALGHVTTFVYDGRDNLTVTTNPLSQSTAFQYDGNDRLTRVTTPLGNQTMMSYSANGRLHQLTDARSSITEHTYTARGDLSTVTTPLGHVQTFNYDLVGRVTGATDLSGRHQSFSYDGNDRMESIQQSHLPGQLRRHFTHSALGQRDFTDEEGRQVTIDLNEFGLPVAVRDALGNETKTEYDPSHNPVVLTDAMGRVTRQSYDDANRPLVMIDPRGKKTTRHYDENGNLTRFTDKRGSKTSFLYDANHRLIGTTDELGRKVTKSRDALGRLETIKNARDQQVHHLYDADGRLVEKKHQMTPSAPSVTKVQFGYDAVGNLLQRTDDWGTTIYAYNAADQVTQINYPTGHSVNLTYTPSGELESVGYPGGLVVAYGYENRSAVSSPTKRRSGILAGGTPKSARVVLVTMSKSAQSKAIHYEYDKSGLATFIGRPDQAPDTTVAHDPAAKFRRVDHRWKSSEVLAFREYDLDAAGNVVAEWTMGEEMLAPPLPEVATLSYNRANQVVQRNRLAYGYDRDGNLISIGGGAFSATYDPENRVVEMTRNGAGGATTVVNTFDGSGMRVRKEVGGAITHFHYGPGGRLLFTTDGADAVQMVCVWKEQVLVAVLPANGAVSDLIFPVTAPQGHIDLWTTLGGEIRARLAYDHYGNVLRDAAVGEVPELFSYAGALGVEDEGGGLYSMRHRFYDATSGRFLQRDPIGLSGDNNLYAYASGNPQRFVDPYGLSSRPWDDDPGMNYQGYYWSQSPENRENLPPPYPEVELRDLTATEVFVLKSVKNWIPYSSFADAAYDLGNGEYKSGAWNLGKGVVGITYGVPVNIVGQIEIIAEAAGLELGPDDSRPMGPIGNMGPMSPISFEDDRGVEIFK